MPDLRDAWRALRSTPVVSVAAVLSLALGIGANTAIFSIVNGLLLRTLPVRDAQGLVSVGSDTAGQDAELTYPVWLALRERNLFDGTFAWASDGLSEVQGGETRPVKVIWATGRFFETLGVPAALGRTLNESDDRRGAEPAAVISSGFWKRRFGGAADVAGRTIVLDRVPFTIAGVADATFFGLEVGASVDVILPLEAEPRLARGRSRLTQWPWLHIVGRIQPGRTPASTAAALAAAQPAIRMATMPDLERSEDREAYLATPWTLHSAATGTSRLRGRYGPALTTLLVIAGFVLLIGIRLALGARRGGISALVLRRLALLSLAGVVVGAVASLLAGRVVQSLLFGVTTSDPATFLAALFVLFVTCVAAGWLPARRRAHRSHHRPERVVTVMKNRIRHSFVIRHSSFAIVTALFVTSTASAQWPQWRGPTRDGAVPAAAVPKWPEKWTRAWRVDVGEGYSSPVVSNGRVFVHSRRDPEEIVTAIDLGSGKIAWQQKYATPFNKNQYATSMSKGPYATPLVIGNTLVTIGGMAIVTAWNTTTGAQVWRKDYSASVDTSKLFTGTAASPLSEGGSVIVQVGSDLHGGKIVALNPQTGVEKWTWTGKGPGYASPVAITASGQRLIVTMTEGSIEGLDAATGAALWSVPFPDDWHENIVTPVWTGTSLIVSGTRQGTHAFTISKQGGRWNASEIWKNGDVAMYMSTPVLADGVLYGLSARKKGQIVALDAATGAVKWMTEGRAADQAAILLTPAHVLVQTAGGELVLFERSAAAYKEVKRYPLADSATWAVPAVLADALIVRDATSLMKLMP